VVEEEEGEEQQEQPVKGPGRMQTKSSYQVHDEHGAHGALTPSGSRGRQAVRERRLMEEG
jgi:hypothetical protein